MSFWKPSKNITQSLYMKTSTNNIGESLGRTVLFPAETSEYLSYRMQYRVHNSIFNMLVLAFLAGMFTAFGASLYMYVLADTVVGATNIAKLLAAFCFSTGLIMITFSGSELVTGAVLAIMPVIRGEITVINFLKYLLVILIGNILGVLFIVAIMYYAGLFNQVTHIDVVAIKLGIYKTSLHPFQSFLLGILCNICVCLAIWSSHASLTPSGKVLAIALPITLFATVGFEHIVANLFFLPVAFLYMNPSVDLVSKMFFNNLLPVAAGNLVGGAVFGSIMVVAHYPKSLYK